jgi:hypothetical protein
MTTPVAGFTAAERFPCTLTYGTFIRRFIPMMAVICLLPPMLLTGLGLALPISLVLVAALAVVITLVSKRGFDRTWGVAELELSAAGATVVRPNSRVHLPWSGIRLGKADLVTPRYATSAPLNVQLVTALVIVTTRRRKKAALVGAGPLYAQIAIVLSIYEKSWEDGRVGAWIRAYRPDLLARPVTSP